MLALQLLREGRAGDEEELGGGIGWLLSYKPFSTVEKSFHLLSNIGALLSLVTVFFSFFPLLMSERRAFLPACSVLFKVGFSVLATANVGGGGGAGGGGTGILDS